MRRALGNLRLTPHSKIKLTPFELQFGRKPNTEIRNTTGNNVSEHPQTSLIYAFRDNSGRDIDNLSLTLVGIPGEGPE